jgi:hypothetical protein
VGDAAAGDDNRIVEATTHSATGRLGSVGQVSDVVDGILFPESSPTSPARSSTLMAAGSQVTDGTCTGLVTRGFCRL